MSAVRAAIPSIDPGTVFDVQIEDGVFTRIDPVADRQDADDITPQLWPGYVECHTHLALPANWDDTVEDPRILALQYLYHGVTHVVDMFGFPLVQSLWERGQRESSIPYPELVHCGYAVTSMRDRQGLTGHGVEFPAPVYMLGVPGEVESVLRANRERGAQFLKVMYTDGTEAPVSTKRFSRISTDILHDAAQVARAQGVPTVVDCNTRDEVLAAYRNGFRLFAHPVRDQELTDDDWRALPEARFISTISGLRPMVMERDDFLYEYSRAGFQETQDLENLAFVSTIKEPFGIAFNCQQSRTAALANMRHNSRQALRRDALLVGTDSGNTGAYHGYSLIGELRQIAGGETDPGDQLRRTATVRGWQFFQELTGQPTTGQPIAVGRAATFNLFTAHEGRALTAIPSSTVVKGVTIDRQAIISTIRSHRTSTTKGKVIL